MMGRLFVLSTFIWACRIKTKEITQQKKNIKQQQQTIILIDIENAQASRHQPVENIKCMMEMLPVNLILTKGTNKNEKQP